MYVLKSGKKLEGCQSPGGYRGTVGRVKEPLRLKIIVVFAVWHYRKGILQFSFPCCMLALPDIMQSLAGYTAR